MPTVLAIKFLRIADSLLPREEALLSHSRAPERPN
jgi:hypothetical protein